MFIGYFTERPYQDPKSGYFGATGKSIMDLNVSNEIYDAQLGSNLYNRYLDEKIYAEEMGFDGLMLNEHHSTPFCMGRRDERRGVHPGPHHPARQNRPPGQHHPHLGRPPLAGRAARHDRHDLPRPPRIRLGARHRTRERLPQRRTALQLGALQGSPRAHRQGVDYPRPLPLGGQALPLPPRQTPGCAPTRSPILPSGSPAWSAATP